MNYFLLLPLLLPRAAVTGKDTGRSQPGHKPVIVCEGQRA